MWSRSERSCGKEMMDRNDRINKAGKAMVIARATASAPTTPAGSARHPSFRRGTEIFSLLLGQRGKYCFPSLARRGGTKVTGRLPHFITSSLRHFITASPASAHTHVLHDPPAPSPGPGAHDVEIAAGIRPDAMTRAEARIAPVREAFALQVQDADHSAVVLDDVHDIVR